MKKIQLSDHFTYQRLLKFTFPSIIMMIFTSLYGVVDGIFVSNYAGKTAFAAINLIWPVVMILGAIGFMFGTGGSALVAKILGEQNKTYANRVFSAIVYTSALLGIVLSILGLIYIRPIVAMLGAEGQLAEDTVLYGSVLFIAVVTFILQNEFQSLLVVAEKPKMGLYVTVGAGVTNIVFDYILIGVLGWGLFGAAVATAFSQVVGCVIPLCYFTFNKKGVLHLGKPGWYPKEILKSCTNGASEMLSNISLSLVNILYNMQFFKIAGENGLSAYGVMMYINFVFVSAFLGYSMGVAPVISYHYGAKNTDELHNLLKKSMTILAVCSVAMFLSAELLSAPLSALFVGFDETLYQMTYRGFMIYSVSFLLSGFNIFASAFFTALNNGVVSAILSFLRTLVFPIITVWIFPLFFGLDGLWSAVIGAELLAILFSIGFLTGNQKRYQY
ncbi:MAG: MATE family efflux transporter [Ruminococcaceae bacterium]|nr:MATE family efflux transporter [Oscillospiraceae bacterium]